MTKNLDRRFTFFAFLVLSTMSLFAHGSAQELIRESVLGTRQGVTIKKWTYTSDGLLVKGELYLPGGEEKLPLVLFNHDGIHGISKEHRYSSVRLAKAGFVVFRLPTEERMALKVSLRSPRERSATFSTPQSS